MVQLECPRLLKPSLSSNSGGIGAPTLVPFVVFGWGQEKPRFLAADLRTAE